MGEAKQLIVKPISASDANRVIKSLHYSGKVDPRSQFHLGVFFNGKCGGAMSFGPSVNKHASRTLFLNCGWNEWIELHRMAFADWLPRNGESRCIAYAIRYIKKHYPHISFLISYSDGSQCGDGTIYRASGFSLTQIKKNTSMWKCKNGEVVCDLVTRMKSDVIRNRIGMLPNEKWSTFQKRGGAVRLEGFQLRYIYFLDPTARDRLTVPILPFSEIDKHGAGMYKGVKKCADSIVINAPCDQQGEGGAEPTSALHPFSGGDNA